MTKKRTRRTHSVVRSSAGGPSERFVRNDDLRACRKPALSGTTTRLTQVSIVDIVSQCDSPSSSADSSEETPMTDTSDILSRREFVKASAAAAAAAVAALPGAAFAAAPDKGADTGAD